MELIVGGQSDIGIVREENEDSLAIYEPTERYVRERKGVMIALADGMGGLDDGSTASKLAVETVVRRYYESNDAPRAALEAAAKDANRAIFEHSRQSSGGRTMGSTLTAAVIFDGHALVAQVGDSRAYHYQGGQLRQVTRDHSLVRELADTGRIAEGSAQYHFHRNVLTRGLGLREEVTVDILEVPELESGDRLVVTSDGLHELVRPEELTAGLKKHGVDVDAACKELVELARQRGGPDNITIAVACVEGRVRSALYTQGGLIPRPSRAAIAAGWLLPFVVFGSFAAGVALTLLVQAGGVTPDQEVELRRELDAALEATRSGAPEAERIDRVRERLEKAKEALEW